MIVYTALFGQHGDELQEPAVPADGTLQYHAYVEPWPLKDPSAADPQFHRGWQLIPQVWQHPNPRLRARRHKLLSHVLYPTEEYVLWVDGCLTPRDDPRELPERYLQHHDIATFKHRERQCVYQELQACLRLRKDDPEKMRRQVAKYLGLRYPRDRGLAETTAILRRQTPAVRTLNESWWQELRENSLRDQLSFDPLCWLQQLTYAHLAGSRIDSPHFAWRAHHRR